MSGKRPVDLSRLDAPERLRTFDAPLLERAPDPELQRVVAEAAAVSGFPIALVSLVVERIQFFRAQVGLPPELEAARATARCNSLCQFVVSSDSPLQVEDAAREGDLPQDLVERFGIHAYVGYPLRVRGQTVGSLCVIDVKPARPGPEVLARLEALARAASARLEELAGQLPPLSGSPAEAEAHAAWRAVAEAQPLFSLGEQFAQGRVSLEELERALGALGTLSAPPAAAQEEDGPLPDGDGQER